MVKHTNDKVRFRLFETPCCHLLLCWVNPRLPNYCPECGKNIFIQVKSGAHTMTDSEAWLKIQEPVK
jgi:hypothetical protein